MPASHTAAKNALARVSVAGCVAIALACGSFDPVPTPAAPAPAMATEAASPPPLVLKKHTFHDAGSGGMASHTMLAPADWTADGRAWWPPPDAFQLMPSHDVRLDAPDWRRVRVAPAFGASDFRPSFPGVPRSPEGKAEGGYFVLYKPDDPEGWRRFVQKAVQQAEPQATSVACGEVTDVPELTAAYEPLMKLIRQMQDENTRFAQASGLNVRYDAGAAVLTTRCTFDLDGRSWEQQHLFGTTYQGMDSDLGRQIFWGVDTNLALRGPAGELDASLPLMLTLAWSLQPTPEWQQMVWDHAAKMQGINAKGMQDRYAITRQAQEDAFRAVQDGHAARTAASDASHQRFIDTIREVDTYTPPGGGDAVRLPSGYAQVYGNGQGDFVLSNAPGFDPNGSLGSGWQSAVRAP